MQEQNEREQVAVLREELRPRRRQNGAGAMTTRARQVGGELNAAGYAVVLGCAGIVAWVLAVLR